MNARDLHVVSFSPVQRCWHVESLADHVRSNARNLDAGTLGVTAYCAVGLVEGREAAHRFIERMQAALRHGVAKPRYMPKREPAGACMRRRASAAHHAWKAKREGAKYARGTR